MTDFVKLYMAVDASGMTAGEQALDRIAQKGGQAEAKVGKAMDGVAASSRKAAKGLDDAEKAASGAAQGFKRTSGAAEDAGRQARTAAGHTANLTSQWNDIAVMIAAGQNPVQLAMQQGTQVNQVIQQMGGGVGAIKALGASFLSMLNPINLATLGIIGFGAAGIQALLSLVPASKSFDDAVDSLSGAVKDYSEAARIAGLSSSELAASFGAAVPHALEFYRIMRDVADLAAEKNFRDTWKALAADAGFDATTRSVAAPQARRSVARIFGRSTGSASIGSKDINEFLNLTKAVEEAASLEARLAAVNDLLAHASEMSLADGKQSDSELDLLTKIGSIQRELLALSGEKTKGHITQLELAQRYSGETRTQWEARGKAAHEEIETLNRQAQMNALIAQYGSESTAVTLARLRAEREAAAELARSTYGANDLADAVMRAWDAANGIASVDLDGNITIAESATWTWAGAMAGVRAEINGILGAINALGGGAIANAAKFTELEALRAGKTVAQAARARREFEIGASFTERGAALDVKEAGAKTWVERQLIRGQRLALGAEQSLAMSGLGVDEELSAARSEAAKREREANKKGGKGSKGEREAYGKSVQEIMRETQAFLAQADAMAKVTAAGGDWERTLAVIEEEQRLLNAAQRSGVELTPDVKAGIRQMAEAYIDAEEKLEGMRDATERGQDAMEDFFGSIFDGSKSAREALGDLLAEMAKAQFKAGAMGLLGGLGGGGILKTVGSLLGGELPSFDGGGYTGDGARTGGLDGKGGYLAMVHPQETISDHTKGGGGGAVSVIATHDPGILVKVIDSRVDAKSPAIVGQSVQASGLASRSKSKSIFGIK